MVTTYLMGGHGNNLFQVAATIGTASRNNCEYVIPESWAHAWMFAGEFNLATVHLPRYNEPHFHYSPIDVTNVELYGYFQSELYFKHCEKLIRKLLKPCRAIEQYIDYHYYDLIRMTNTCAIHVRRGDYLQLSEYHYNLEVDYYTKIIEAMPNFHYVCFSDDIEWCKSNIAASQYISDKMGVEFHLMSKMKNQIIANSSFSWWAAWLNDNHEKLVFAPPKNKWFGEKKKHLNVDDLYCPNWL